MLLSALVERFGVSRMQDFCVQLLKMDKSGADLLAQTTLDLLKTEVGYHKGRIWNEMMSSVYH